MIKSHALLQSFILKVMTCIFLSLFFSSTVTYIHLPLPLFLYLPSTHSIILSHHCVSTATKWIQWIWWWSHLQSRYQRSTSTPFKTTVSFNLSLLLACLSLLWATFVLCCCSCCSGCSSVVALRGLFVVLVLVVVCLLFLFSSPHSFHNRQSVVFLSIVLSSIGCTFVSLNYFPCIR